MSEPATQPKEGRRPLDWAVVEAGMLFVTLVLASMADERKRRVQRAMRARLETAERQLDDRDGSIDGALERLHEKTERVAELERELAMSAEVIHSLNTQLYDAAHARVKGSS